MSRQKSTSLTPKRWIFIEQPPERRLIVKSSLKLSKRRRVVVLQGKCHTLILQRLCHIQNSRVLYRWTGDRPFGRLLDGASNINLEKNLITIEIKGLDDYPDSQQVMLLLLTDFIKATPNVLLIIDEAWRLFSGLGQSFAIEAYGTLRKYGSGIWCISQNYRDFLADKALADTLMPNTVSIFILPQKGIDWQDLQQKLQLNDSELEAIKELQTKKGKYSELFLIQGENKSILKMASDILAYWVATSDPNDNAKIKRKEQESPFLSTLEILQQLGRSK